MRRWSTLRANPGGFCEGSVRGSPYGRANMRGATCPTLSLTRVGLSGAETPSENQIGVWCYQKLSETGRCFQFPDEGLDVEFVDQHPFELAESQEILEEWTDCRGHGQKSRDWLSTNQGPVYPDSVGSTHQSSPAPQGLYGGAIPHLTVRSDGVGGGARQLKVGTTVVLI
eukprot:sb/3472265/